MRVAVVQMNSGEDKAQNLSTAERLLIDAAARGAELAVLPELFSYLGRRAQHTAVAESIPGPTAELMMRIARQHHLHLVAGSYLEAGRDRELLQHEPRDPGRRLDREAPRYRKLHLFDVDVDGHRSRESDTMVAGQDVVPTPRRRGRADHHGAVRVHARDGQGPLGAAGPRAGRGEPGLRAGGRPGRLTPAGPCMLRQRDDRRSVGDGARPCAVPGRRGTRRPRLRPSRPRPRQPPGPEPPANGGPGSLSAVSAAISLRPVRSA